MVFNKKGISPVVATALLLVVAVVAVVGFQTWFNTYQSGLNTKVEQQSAAGSAITIERLENGTVSTVYLKNADTSDIVATTIKAGTDLSCVNSSVTLAASSVTPVSLACSSLTVGAPYDVVVVTGNGVYSGKVLAR